MPSRVQYALDFRCLCLRLQPVFMLRCCRVRRASSATSADIVAVCTTMARALRQCFLDGLSIQTYDRETHIITCAVGAFAEAVPLSVHTAHATSVLDWGTCKDARI